MVMIAICSSLIGAVLGTRLKVLVLIPATVLGLSLVIAVTAINGTAGSSAILAAGVLTICLQLGYLAGLLTRLCMTASRMPSRRIPHPSTTVAE